MDKYTDGLNISEAMFFEEIIEAVSNNPALADFLNNRATGKTYTLNRINDYLSKRTPCYEENEIESKVISNAYEKAIRDVEFFKNIKYPNHEERKCIKKMTTKIALDFLITLGYKHLVDTIKEVRNIQKY